MKKVLVVLLVAIVGVIVFVPEVRKELLNLTKDTAEDMKIVEDEETAVPDLSLIHI